MTVESYSLEEASELLGMSPRLLQRKLQEGAFPGRFMVGGRAGPEARLPAADVDRAVAELRRRGQLGWRPSEAPASSARPERGITRSTIASVDALESGEPYQTPELIPSSPGSAGAASLVTHSDLESLRDAMLAIVREDREVFLNAVREALLVRDREIGALRQELTSTRKVMEGVRAGLESLERKVLDRRAKEQTIDAQLWTELVDGIPAAAARGTVDLDALLREIGELESMLQVAQPD